MCFQWIETKNKSISLHMIININPEEVSEFQTRISRKDMRIAELEKQVEQLTRERDLALSRASLPSNDETESMTWLCSRFIVISKQKLKNALAKIQDANAIGLLGVLLQKCLHEDATPEESTAIIDAISLPQSPSLSLTAEGDVKVSGNYIS